MLRDHCVNAQESRWVPEPTCGSYMPRLCSCPLALSPDSKLAGEASREVYEFRHFPCLWLTWFSPLRGPRNVTQSNPKYKVAPEFHRVFFSVE